jgi:eukaryotic-like serine/threonine-protein kinase
VRRFAQERDIVAQLSHPGIARLFDAGSTRDGYPYYAMELVDGKPITAWCEERKLSIAARLELFLKVCDAVRFAHANLVLHRDIKPANVLVDAEGAPKLIDFGIAKQITASDDTATGLQLFSPSNAAPEQLRGERCGVACDVYQLGTLLYEMLSGRSVIGAADSSPSAIEAAILRRVPARPSEVVADRFVAKQLRGDLDAIVLRALRKEPEQRYASVEQFADDLRRHLHDEPIAARGGDRLYRARKFVARNAVAVSAGGTVVLLVLAFLATMFVQAQRLQRERDSARRENARAEQVTRFLVSLFKAADPRETLSRTTPVSRVLDTGRRRLAFDLKDHPELRSKLMLPLSDIYLGLDDPQTAATLLADAEAADREAGGGMLDEIDVLVRRADIEYRGGDSAAARPFIERARALQVARGVPVQQTWPARQLESQILHELLPRSEWRPIAEKLHADMLAAGETAPQRLASAEQDLAVAYNSDDDLKRTLDLHRSAVSRLEASLPPRHPDVLNARGALADTMDVAGQSREALAMLLDVQQDTIDVLGPHSTAAARGLVRIGNVHWSLKEFDQAIPYFEQALASYEAIHRGPHPDIMAAAFNAANSYAALRRFEESDVLYRRAIDVSTALWGRENRTVQYFIGVLGGTMAERKLWREAEPLLRESVGHIGYRSVSGAEVVAKYAETLIEVGRPREAVATLDKLQGTLDEHPERLGELQSRLDELRRRAAR